MIRKKTGPGRPAKRTSSGKSESRKSDGAKKRTSFGKSETFKGDRPEKRVSYGKSDSRKSEGPGRRSAFAKTEGFSDRSEKRTSYGKSEGIGKKSSFDKTDDFGDWSERPKKKTFFGKTEGFSSEKRATSGKSGRSGKRTSFGKAEGFKSDRSEKMTSYGKKEGKRGERAGTAGPERRTRRPLSASRPSPVGKARRHEVAEERGRFEEKQHDVIYGVNPVLEAFKAGRGMEKLILAEGRAGKEIEEIISLARGRNIKILFEPREALTRLSRTEGHQGVLAMVSAGRYAALDEILKKAKDSGSPFILILDSIQDPQNLGAIIRSAVCAGVHGIVIPKDRAVGLTSTVDKASAGAMEYMPVAKVTNIAHTLDELKDEGFWIIGTEGKAKTNLYSADLKGPVGLVIGSEGEGIRPLVAKKCDLLVSIPIMGKVTSLNASAAAAVVMYEVVRQRGGK